MGCSTQVVIKPRPGYNISCRVVSPNRDIAPNRDKSGKDQTISGFVAGDHLIFYANSIDAETAWFQISSPGGFGAWVDDTSSIVGGGPSFNLDSGHHTYNLSTWPYWSSVPAVTYVDEIVIDSVVCGASRSSSGITSHRIVPGDAGSYLNQYLTPFTPFHVYHAQSVPENDFANNVVGWTPSDNSPVPWNGPYQLDDTTPAPVYYKVVQIMTNGTVIPYAVVKADTAA